MHKLETQYVFQGNQSSPEVEIYESGPASPRKESGDTGFNLASSGVSNDQGMVIVDLLETSEAEPHRQRAKSCHDMPFDTELKENNAGSTGIEKSLSVQEFM